MKLLKLVGLAIIVGTMMMLLTGSAKAAPGLFPCAVAEESPKGPCSGELTLFYGSYILHTPSFALTSTLSVECAEVEIAGAFDKASESAERPYGQFNELSPEECSSSCGAATVAGFNMPWRFEAISTKAEVIEKVGIQYTTCGETCKYEVAKVTTEFKGGEKATSAVKGASMTKVSGGLACPKTASWSLAAGVLPADMNYAVTL